MERELILPDFMETKNITDRVEQRRFYILNQLDLNPNKSYHRLVYRIIDLIGDIDLTRDASIIMKDNQTARSVQRRYFALILMMTSDNNDNIFDQFLHDLKLIIMRLASEISSVKLTTINRRALFTALEHPERLFDGLKYTE